MDDYISRQAVIDAIHCDITITGRQNAELVASTIGAFVDRIKALPPADVVQVRHGRWLPIVSYNNTYKCSECGRLLVDITDGLKMVAKHYPYCHCGAKMDGGENG